ncbi:MAG: FAD-dependent thymidylate synthase [Clostridia bacterium]|nr:FAD-dependent thymidylate synthase [Clostridia bacterium]
MIRIIASTSPGKRVCAAAARLSTREGMALSVFESSDGGERDEKLIKKVMSSGHRSLLEHQSFSFALDGVSVFVEQCLIEFRLSSFTVKSRRYVDFKSAGYYTPGYLKGEALELYTSSMNSLFGDYAKLVDMGIPREDARFLLPYCFYSSMYLTCNARELAHIINAFTTGRLSAYDEIRKVGSELSKAFEGVFPDTLEAPALDCRVRAPEKSIETPRVCDQRVILMGEPRNADELLRQAVSFSGRFSSDEMELLVKDARPRELECLSYTFLIKNISQSCVTHFARHRIQSPMFESPSAAISKNLYVLPESIAADSRALQIYNSAFNRNTQTARKLMTMGLNPDDLVYLSLSGNTIDALITMNARELRHFMNLRTCERAQWEIRNAANSMLEALIASYPGLFRYYGPSCMTLGRCPEGRLSCGHPKSGAPIIPEDRAE